MNRNHLAQLACCFLLMACLASPAHAQENVWYQKGLDLPAQPTALPAAEINARFKPVIGALSVKNLDQARSFLRDIRQEAAKAKDEPLRDQAQILLDRVRTVYEPMLRQWDKGAQLRQQGDFPGAQAALNSALAIAEANLRDSPPDLVEVGRELEQRLRSERDLLQQERLRIFQERLGTAEQFFWNGAFDQAAPLYENASGLLMEKEEASEYQRVKGLAAQAQYRALLDRGDKLIEAELFVEAIDLYTEAQKKFDNAEVTQRLNDAKSRQHYLLLQRGQALIREGKYREACQLLQDAAFFAQTEYLERIRQNTYQELREKGLQALSTGATERALEHFDLARLYIDSEEIQADISQLEGRLSYSKESAEADQLLERGLIAAAEERLQRAARFQTTPELEQRLVRIARYKDNMDQAKKMLKNDPQAAFQHYSEAHSLFPTEEAKRGMARAESKGAVSSGKLY